MKSSTLPAVRVEPELREQVEHILQDGETLSDFVAASVREGVRRRLDQTEFIKRGLLSLEEAKRTGERVSARDVIDMLERKLAAARAKKASIRRR